MARAFRRSRLFGLIGVFFFGLLFLQRRDLDAGAAVDAKHGVGGPRQIEDPTKLDEGELWAALAVKPVDSEALQPLGLAVTQRPEIRFETRAPTMPGYSARLRGPLVLSGKRHGRTVSVNQ